MTLLELHKFCHSCKRLFCYGAGRYGRTLLVHLQENGIDIVSFLITAASSDNFILGKPVKSVKETAFEKEDGVILAVGERFIDSMKREIELLGVTNYISVDETLLSEIEAETEFSTYQNNAPFVNVLMYHRVVENIDDPYGIAVSPKNFREHMAYLKQNFNVLRFNDDWNDIKEPSVVVTFDDGYADNFNNALPILEEYGIYATFFVSTENLDTDNLFWWDKLSLLFSACKNETVRLGEHEFNCDDLKMAHAFLHRLLPKERNQFLCEAEQENHTISENISDYRALSLQELKQLSNSPLATIGAHTVTHSSLSCEPKAMQEWEIKESRKQVESIIGREVSVFSYPFGDYNESTVSTVKNSGIRKACTVTGGLYLDNCELKIPRNKVVNITGAEFEKFMRRCRCIYA